MNKKGQSTTLRTFLIGFIVILFVTAIGGNYVSNIVYNYGIEPDENISKLYGSFNKTLLNASYKFGSSFQAGLDDKSGDNLDTLGGEAGVLKTMYEVIKLPFNILPNMMSTINLFGGMLGIPGWVVKPILGIIMIVLSAIILGIIFRSTGT